ncbi:MAG: DUF1573 domain-containing protein, partial [Crocinitomicaceae bacterium]|nr:DUF1573 domain-containing protein [Crocinitomicaceae bacterium]
STGHLYFSSSWHNGFGGQDVFRVAGIPGNWTDPVNMGPPVNSNKNDFFFSVFPEKEKVFLSSNREGAAIGDGYSTCCNDIYVADLPSKIIEEEKKEEYKNLAELNRFLPVRLYFHNDEPNPRSLDTTTLVKYSEAYDSYKKLFDSYVKENAKGLSGSEKEDAEYDVEDFFSLTVDKGMSDLSLFFDLLLKELKQGQSIRLSIRGFASPRAKSDYNEKLTMRRIASLVNEMKSVQNGIFLPYINGTATDGGHLEFEALPFGEYKADKTVSDDLFNEKQSIYSRGARLERKIEIESVKIVSPIKKPVLKLEEESFDFGPIPKSGVVHHTFYISNEGNALMVIDSVIASCGCLVPILEKDTVLPSERIALEVGFIPFDKNGKETKEITIYIAGEPPKVITISADVQH